ncbi:MAG: hypothetical protein SNG69_07245 [Rikenellaceae bacterium]
MNITIETYSSANYHKWVAYAQLQINIAHMPYDAEELVNSIWLRLVEKDPQKVEQLMNQQSGDESDFEFYIKRIIRTSIISPRSQFRYKRGQHCTDDMEGKDHLLGVGESDDTFDYDKAYLRVVEVFNELEISTSSRAIFAWRFIEGKPFSEWQGKESQKSLYETFNTIKTIISAKIREK